MKLLHFFEYNTLIIPGIMNVTFPLSDQPVLGEWTIFAEVGTQLFNKTFQVKKYGKFHISN